MTESVTYRNQGGYKNLAFAPRIRRPLAGSLIGRVPESIASVALVMLLRARTGGYGPAGVAAAGLAIGSALAAPLAGRALDRVDEGKLLAGLAGVFACAVVAIVASAGSVPEALLVGMAVVAGAARPPLDAAMRALWARVVPGEQLRVAYSLDATLQELIWILGPLLLAGLLLLAGPSLPLFACAALSLVGTLIYVGGVSTRQAMPGRAESARLHSLALDSLLSAATLYGVAVGMLTLALTASATAHHARAAVGVLVALWGIGSIVGGIAYGAVSWRSPPERRAPLLLAALALLLALLTAAPGLVVLGLLMFPLGLPLSPWLGTLNEAAQRLVAPTRTAEVFTWIYSLIALGIAAGNAVAGPLIESAGTSVAFLAAASAAGAGAGLGAAGVAIARRRALR